MQQYLYSYGVYGIKYATVHSSSSAHSTTRDTATKYAVVHGIQHTEVVPMAQICKWIP